MKRRAAAASAALTILPLLAAAGACGSGESEVEARVSERDSAGIRIIEVSELNDRPAGWTIGPEPRLMVGGDAEDEGRQLFRVAGAAVRSDGRLLVANGGTSELRLFEADGTPANTFGGKGSGPAEFELLTFLRLLPGDSALAHDARLRRFTVVAPDMTLGRTFGVENVVGFPVATFPGGPVLLRGSAGLGSEPSSGVHDGAAPHVLVTLGGAVVDTMGTLPRGQSYLKLGEASIQVVAVPFGTTTWFAEGGDLVHVGTGERFEIRGYDRAGRLSRILRVAVEPRAVTGGDVEREIESRLARVPESARPAQRRLYEEIEAPETMPAHGPLVMDATGALWVQRYQPWPEGPNRWTVFDSDGRPRGTVETPAGVTILEIGEDYVLGKGTDALDREYVAVWGLERGS